MLGRLRQALNPERDAGAAWEKGAEGERQLAESLQPLVETGAIRPLHDRRIPGSRANIDHLVVAATGVWVIDTKRYQGAIRREFRGSIFSGGHALTVRGRDRTALVLGVHKQLEHVTRALSGRLADRPPVRGVLCFVDGEWGWRWRPFRIEGVEVTWPKALRAALSADGPLDDPAQCALVDALETSFPPAG